MPETTADTATPSDLTVGPKIEAARAKINLALHVRSRRPDGYHVLDSLVVFAGIADTLQAVTNDGPGFELVLDGAFADILAAEPPERNLVNRAAAALKAVCDGPFAGVTVNLTKRLPVASGIGGGSADAAAALRLLNRVWRIGLDDAALAALGARLGADVPACLLSRPLRMTGIGDRLIAAAGVPSLPLVLVNPGVAVSTGLVFERYRPAPSSPLPPLPAAFADVAEVVRWLGTTRNDLEEAALSEAAVIDSARQALSAEPECLLARMSGSGATVFGIFPTAEKAARAADRLRGRHTDWWIVATSTGAS